MTKPPRTKYRSIADQMREMLSLSNEAIAERLGCKVDTVRGNRKLIANGFVPIQRSWTDERVERLKELVDEGLSASDIARRLGNVSRNGVIGKVHRIGLVLKGKDGKRPSAPKFHPWKPRVARPVSPVRAILCDGLPIPTPAETDIPRVSFLELNEDGERHCKWPCIPDVRDHPQHEPLYCGLEPVAGLQYCNAHAKRAFALVRPRSPSQMPEMPASVLEVA